MDHPLSGNEPWDSRRDWRLGLAERIESIWARVGRSDGSSDVSERMVRDVARDLNKSHDEMLNLERPRCRNLGK